MAKLITHHLGIAQVVSQDIKKAEADELRAHVDAFIARGHTIEKLAHGASAYVRGELARQDAAKGRNLKRGKGKEPSAK